MTEATSSPFTPGQPAPKEIFVGRRHEIDTLLNRLHTAKTGRLQVAFLSGERGIGKSSLASLMRFLAVTRHDALTLHVFLGGVSSLETMVHRVFDRLVTEQVGRSTFDRINDLLGKYIDTIGLFGLQVGFRAPKAELRSLADNFDVAVRNIYAKVKDENPVLLFVLDDIDGLASQAEFANWLKSFVDAVATSSEPLSLLLVLVGTEERRHEIVALQPSLARVFDLIEMEPWSEEETKEFFKTAFERVGMSVDNAALRTLARYAGGLPVMAHEIGDAVFRLARGPRIAEDDALGGIFAAADNVGRKHLQPAVLQYIRSPKYKSMLRKIAEDPSSLFRHAFVFRRADVMSELSNGEKTGFR